MSSDWQLLTLGEFLQLQRGHDLTAGEQLPGRVPVMGSAGPNGTHSVAKAKGPGVVIGRSGSSIGRVHFSAVDFWPHNTCLYVTDFFGNNQRFAFYLLQTLNLATYNSGSAQPSLNRNYIYSIKLRVPGRPEQDRIVELLEVLEDEIALLKQINITLEAIAQTLFKSWFIDFDPVHAKVEGLAPEGIDQFTAALFPDSFETSALGIIPRGWRVSTISGVCANIFSGGTPSTSRPDFWTGDFKWLSSGETRDSIITDTEKRISQAAVDGSSTRLALPGDVVIASAGQGKTRGQTSYCAIPTSINQAVIALRAYLDRCEPSWLYYNLARRYEEMRMLSDSHSIRGSLTSKLLADMKSCIPPPPVMAAFGGIANSLLDAQVNNAKEAKSLSDLRDAFLPRLISGKLRIPEAEELIEEVAA